MGWDASDAGTGRFRRGNGGGTQKREMDAAREAPAVASIPPAIAIDQTNPVRASRQSVGLPAVGAATDNEGVLTGTKFAAKLAIQLPNSRVAESEADRLGIELAPRAGCAPAAAVTPWRKMEGNSGSRPPEFLSTHPSPANCRVSLAALVPEMRKLKPTTLRKPLPVEILH